MLEVARYGILFGCLFLIMAGGGHLLRPGKLVTNHILALLSWDAAGLLLLMFLHLSGLHFEPAHLNYLYLPLIYVGGPAMYIVFRVMTESEYTAERHYWMFLPAALLLPALPLSYDYAPHWYDTGPVEYYTQGALSPPDVIILVGLVVNGFYYIAAFLHSRAIFRFEELRREPAARILLSILVGSLLFNGAMAGLHVTRNAEGMVVTAFGISVFAAVTFMTTQTTPHLFQELGIALRKAYKTSRLSGVDVDSLDRELKRLMEDEKVFLNEDLTVNDLAAELDIKPYQLSEFLNAHLEQNFARFVNGYRVEEAARILLEDEAASILAVAFRVGFNSKATFNQAFKAVKGLSPREFLKHERDRKPRRRNI